MSKLAALSAFVVSALLLNTAVEAAGVFPVKAYTKPDEAIVVKFVQEKGDEGKKAVAELGVDAGRLEFLFAPAPATDIAGADGTPAFKIFSAAGEEQKVAPVTPKADGSVDLSAACPKLKEGGTFFLVWKDAPPLVIETLFNPAYQYYKSRIAAMTPDQRKKAVEQFGPVVTHMVFAEVAVITTDKGVIKAKFSYDDAPHTIDNFISLARDKFYDSSAFHRIISGFMIQGGDSYANVAGKAGGGGPGYQVGHEFSDKKHVKGVLSMARTGADVRSPDGTVHTTQYDTAGAQFFIMHGEKSHLNGIYTAFGDVFEGIAIVDTIARTPVSDDNGTVSGAKPKILSIRIEPATAEIYGLKK